MLNQAINALPLIESVEQGNPMRPSTPALPFGDGQTVDNRVKNQRMSVVIYTA
jgi:hypothetical protein